jgi:hypothetical protein
MALLPNSPLSIAKISEYLCGILQGAIWSLLLQPKAYFRMLSILLLVGFNENYKSHLPGYLVSGQDSNRHFRCMNLSGIV